MEEIKVIYDFTDLLELSGAPACTCSVEGDGNRIVTDNLVFVIVNG